MSKGETRHSRSAYNLMLRGKQVTKLFQDQSKEEIEDISLTLLVNQASTSTITEEPITVNSNYFSSGSNNNNQNTDKLALKLNRLIRK